MNISTGTDPQCKQCGKPIIGAIICGSNEVYHPECAAGKISSAQWKYFEPDPLADLRRRVEALEKAFGIAMQDAMKVIETVGTTAADDAETFRRAEAWLKTYFPERV